MSPPRSTSRAVRSAVTDDRLVGAAAVVALLEGLLRLAAAIRIDPVVAVLWPPVVAVLGLAWAVPAVRAARSDGSVGVTRPGTDAVRGRLLPLVGVAVVGHVLALALGTALFLIVDTSIRHLLYWADRGDLIRSHLVAIAPLVGVSAGALLAWVVPSIAVVRVADGAGAGRGLREAVATPVRTPGTLERPFGCHVGFVALAVGLLLAGVATGRLLDLSFELFAAVLAVGGLIAVFGATLWLAISLMFTVEDAGLPGPPSSGPGPSTVKRLGIAVLVLTSLVATVGAVRVGEVRPVDTSSEPLPDGRDDPDQLYATALENTVRGNYEFRVFDHTRADGNATEPTLVVRRDRVDRQLLVQRDDRAPTYGSMGTAGPIPGDAPDVTLRTWDATRERPFEVGAMPGYPYVEERPLEYAEPSRTAAGWTVRDRSDGELVLELTDAEAVYAAMTGRELDADYHGIDVRESRARAIVDTERGTVTTLEFRIEATATDSGEEHTVHRTYEFESDIDVHRPDEYGSASASEWVWKLFAY